MNVKLLRRIQKHILAEPRRLAMEGWGITGLDADRDTNPPCGTVGCIAGWAVWLDNPEAIRASSASIDFSRTITEACGVQDAGIEGARLLGLDEGKSGRLFHVGDWPRKFERRYYKAKTAKTRAKVTTERIDHFIATKGAE